MAGVYERFSAQERPAHRRLKEQVQKAKKEHRKD